MSILVGAAAPPKSAYLPSQGRFNKTLWPVGLAILLGTFIVVQIYLVTLAGRSFEGPDQVDYYRMGLDYNKEIKRQEAQRSLGWKLTSNLPAQLPATDHFPMAISAVDRQGRHLQGTLMLTLRQPATKRLDQKVKVELQGDQYKADMKLSAGVWDVTMEFHSSSFRWTQTKRIFVTPQ